MLVKTTTTNTRKHPQCTKSNTQKLDSRSRALLTPQSTSASQTTSRTHGWTLPTVSSLASSHLLFAHTNTPTVPDQMISKADFPKLNNPDNAMEVTDPKTGETGYRVGLEVFHQLHCLNLLRMSTYPEYYTKLWWSDTNDKPERVRAHLGTPSLSAFSLPLLMLTRSLH
jgi:hypothetical protein